MIKSIKYFSFVLLFGLFGLINYSFGSCASHRNGILIWLNFHSVGTLVPSSQSTPFNLGIVDYGNFNTVYGSLDKKVLASDNPYIVFRGENGLPYLYFNDVYQGYFSYYGNCPYFSSNPGQPCTVDDLTVDDLPFLSSFFSTVSSDNADYWGYSMQDDRYGHAFWFCVSSQSANSSLCFFFDSNDCPLNSSEGYSGLRYTNIEDDIIFNSPGTPSSGGGDEGGGEIGEGGIELNSNESAINYYESRYGRTRDICYVGVDNVTDLWGTSGVSFQEGSGLSIFQAFSGLYGNEDLNKVYVWINSWLINYNQWFNKSGDPLYLASYNSGNNKIDLYYTGLSFPFANNPVAVYFMANNITLKSPYNTMGSSVVSYCNIKINSGTFEDIIDQSDKNNINGYTEQSNKNNGLNPDGTYKDKNYVGGSSSGDDNRLIFTGNIGTGSSGNVFTWEDMQYSGDVNLKSFFDFSLSEMKSALDNFQNPFTGILPQYIISALLFFALFKLLRK